MSTFSNPPSLPVPSPGASGAATESSASNALLSGSSAQGSAGNILNQGAISTIVASSNNQLTLTAASGKLSIPAAKIPPVLDSGKDVAIKINTDKSTTLLEVSAKYSHQRLSLNSQQSQQVLQTVLQHPGTVSNSLEIRGRVIAIQQNQIQVNVNAQTINLSVRNPQQYQVGQDVKLGLTSGTIGWEATVENNNIKESFRLPAEETQKILGSLKPTTQIELSEKGKQLVRPILKESSNSQLPATINKVCLTPAGNVPAACNAPAAGNDTPGASNRLVVQLDLGEKPIARIKLNQQALQNLSNAELRSQHTQKPAGSQFRENALQNEAKHLLGQAPKGNTADSVQLNTNKAAQANTSQLNTDVAKSDTANKSKPASSPVYQSPVAQAAKIPSAQLANQLSNKAAQNKQTNDVSPELAKTIKASQEQFAELNVNTKKAPEPPPVNEISLSQRKNTVDGVNKVTTAPDLEKGNTDKKPIQNGPVAAEKVNVDKPLSSTAQQILNTLRTLNATSAGDVKQTMLQNINKLVEALAASDKAQISQTPNEIVKPDSAKLDRILSKMVNSESINPTPTKSQPPLLANDILKLIRQVTEQTSAATGTQANNHINKLSTAIEEVIANNNLDEGIKNHIKQALNQVKPEQSGLPIPDMQSVKSLLQSSALPVTPISIITPPSGGGLVAGLINLLQVSLAARLNRTNQQVQDKLSDSLANIVASGAKGKTSAKPAGQNMRELSGLEQKHNLVKLLSDMVNQHSNQKMQNSERTLQGQEAMYYVLPFSQRDDKTPAELMIQRDKPDEAKAATEQNDTKNWLLTMKLPIGDLGEILTMSKVSEEKIEIDLYTSSEELKNITLNYLPLLKRRFDDLGLNLEIGRVERGNIPEKLANNPYQILETRA